MLFIIAVVANGLQDKVRERASTHYVPSRTGMFASERFARTACGFNSMTLS